MIKNWEALQNEIGRRMASSQDPVFEASEFAGLAQKHQSDPEAASKPAPRNWLDSNHPGYRDALKALHEMQKRGIVGSCVFAGTNQRVWWLKARIKPAIVTNPVTLP